MGTTDSNVKVWSERVTIPTYGIGEPEKNPIFLEKRVYQGSSGVVYPNPVVEKIYDEKEDKEWTGLFLENEYLRIMILPELGGRVQMAYDKVKQRHFVYYNHVIKPALVGLTGPWISGGIEFNWPQHHRPSTYQPTDYAIEENMDGSKTVWISQVERMFRTKGMAGFTLYPGKAYMEIKVKLYNRTSQPQTFLWWANPAVKVNDLYQSVFPPDVNAVFDHGKRDVSSFPIATGTYYKVDYSAGVDISRYKNIPVPTSYMAISSKYDFVGGFENDTQGGLLHVADHHVSPGKKQWTWGNGEFGKAWDRNLTDEDGPYIELMCGVYTDNQPDFSWLQPCEEKDFKQYFMPYRDLGVVKNATKDAMVNIEMVDGKVTVMAFTTAIYKGSSLLVESKGEKLLEEQVDFSPEMSYQKKIDGRGLALEDMYVAVKDATGKILVDYRHEKESLRPVPDPARAAKMPEDIRTTEQLYLRGLHLEQYRHATYEPTAYYLEALKRDPSDLRNNNAMGLWLMRKGQFEKAEPYFRTAIDTLTERNPNPYDGEPLFNLGCTLKYQQQYDEAYAAFYKSAWNAAWQDSAYHHLAQIACIRGDLGKALDLINHSLWRNFNHHAGRSLKIAILRKLAMKDEALELVNESLELDAFNFSAWYEKYLLTRDDQVLVSLRQQMRDDVHNYIEYSLDYAGAGMYKEATDLLNVYSGNKDKVYPMVCYFMGWYASLAGDRKGAVRHYQKASLMPPDYCFPNRLEENIALYDAVSLLPDDPKAWYYLGNFWYAGKQYTEAMACWEKSRDLDGSFATVNRNLALGYYNKQNNPSKARTALEKAFALDPSPRILMELDQLNKKQNMPFEDRLALLEGYPSLVESRDDLYLERATLFNLTGRHQKALDHIMERKFHPWEGGEGKVPGQYILSHVEIARKAIQGKDFPAAVSHLRSSMVYPENLGEGKLIGAQENDIHYYLGCAFEGMGNEQEAGYWWEKGSQGISEPAAAMYYNDQPPDKIYYQGLSFLKLGNRDKANSRFNKLLKYGEKHVFDKFVMDYFAVSLPDLLIFEEDLQLKHELHCMYMMGLGHLGLGNTEQANGLFGKILKMDLYHTGALTHIKHT